MGKKAPLEEWLQWMGQWYAQVLVKNPWPFVVVPTIVTLILSTGLFHFHIVRGVHELYSPTDAPWKTEEDTVFQLWASNDSKFYPAKDVTLRNGIFLIATSKSGANVLDPQIASEVKRLVDSVPEMTFQAMNGKRYKYTDVCLRFQNECFQNTHVKAIADVFAKEDQFKMNVTYPVLSSKFLPEPIDLSQVIGGVTLKDGVVVGAKAWLLVYQLKQGSQELTKFSSEFVHQLPIKIATLNLTDLEVLHFHSETFDDELARNAMKMLPKFSVTFTILVIFSILCTFNLTRTEEGLLVDWVRSKPLMGVVGVVSTLMAILNAVGLLLWADVTFVEMCSVMPFLSLTIGIDDSFLMLASWHSTNPTEDLEARLKQTILHAASSITITSATDTVAFLIGSIAPLPAVQYFCYYSCVAILFIYIYTMTFFLAWLSIQGGWERNGRNSFFFWRNTEPYKKELSFVTKITNIGSMQTSESKNKVIWYRHVFGQVMAPCLAKPLTQLVVALLYIVYLGFVSVGINNLKTGFDVSRTSFTNHSQVANIVTDNPEAAKFVKLRAEMFTTDASQFDLIVERPPDFGNFKQRHEFLKVLAQLEGTKCTKSRNYTDFWYFAFQRYMQELGFDVDAEQDTNEEEFQSQLAPFLIASERYSYDIIPGRAFRLTIQLKPFPGEHQITECAHLIRDLCARNSKYNMTTYTPLWNLADQLDTMWPQTMQDIGISVGVMTVVAWLFLPDFKSVLVIGFSIVSVGFGVLGFMDLWSVKLDATSMITIAMSVGFSVDFAAHVVYAFHQANCPEPNQRLANALAMVGWPICQGTLSVCLGVVVLGTIRSYIVQTCFKTVFLVILLGIMHALIVVPILLHNLCKFESSFFKDISKTVQEAD